MITTSPAYDGRMTAGRKGIPYDLSQFAPVMSAPVMSAPVEEYAPRSDDVLVADERVPVAA